MGHAGDDGAAAFHYHPTPRFERKLEKLRGQDPAGYERVREVIGRLLADPADADGKLHGPHRGKLKKYVGRSEYRIVYAWCLSCRKANEHLEEACPSCGAVPDGSVVFLDLYHKSEANRLGY
jgi:hypothetical protein